MLLFWLILHGVPLKFNLKQKPLFLATQALPCIISPPCQNKGTCVNDNKGGYLCKCPNGYMGTNCEIRNRNKRIFKN